MEWISGVLEILTLLKENKNKLLLNLKYDK